MVNQYNKKIEIRGDYLVDITNKYNENERPQNESERNLDETVNKVKAGTKAVINKVKDTDKDLGPEYNKEKQQKIAQLLEQSNQL